MHRLQPGQWEWIGRGAFQESGADTKASSQGISGTHACTHTAFTNPNSARSLYQQGRLRVSRPGPVLLEVTFSREETVPLRSFPMARRAWKNLGCGHQTRLREVVLERVEVTGAQSGRSCRLCLATLGLCGLPGPRLFLTLPPKIPLKLRTTPSASQAETCRGIRAPSPGPGARVHSDGEGNK